ncbi:arylsulfatase [Reichenbachiella carrageenanivorans]|uniref:Arylsulfatase n=1 Tax=Reichenbachiella carrageenanivorans TaxID=2979869 RepID=A0ABY6D563_9BACT|nr:arylsulfatase [Reichenbachiella carrageenanivorans]UXX81301.1 arylsulfatase [Reichenbachiella carrageenanivorans]
MNRFPFFYLVGLSLLLGCTSQKEATHDVIKPNIILIYLDDLGYGDLSSYGATELQTPHIDRLVHGGVKFINGYASSATCTPSRYAILTGRYPWRKNAKILSGTAPLIIDTAQMTLPKMLKKGGYATGLVGKWHLGLGDGSVDWNEQITPGPNEVGFDDAYYMAATQDRVPTVYIDNGYVANLDPNNPITVSYKQPLADVPTAVSHPEKLTMKPLIGHQNTIVNGVPRIGYMKGGATARWKDVDMADHFLAKSQAFIQAHKTEPFFLYYAMQQPHVPRIPHPRFAGKSKLGPRGDVILEADWCIGELMKTLEEEDLLENTLLIFSSDNGPVLNDGYDDQAVELLGDHTPTGGLRGGKYSLFDAGARVPLATYWKGKIKPTVSEALVCQMDLLASLARLVGTEVATSDSQDLLSALLGQTHTGRKALVIEATTRTAYREGDWIMIPPYGGRKLLTDVNIEIGNDTTFQLYNLKEDVAQQHNLAETEPERLKQMLDAFVEIRGEDYLDYQPIQW